MPFVRPLKEHARLRGRTAALYAPAVALSTLARQVFSGQPDAAHGSARGGASGPASLEIARKRHLDRHTPAPDAHTLECRFARLRPSHLALPLDQEARKV